MEKYKKGNITRKLLLSFFLLFIIFLIFGIYTLYDIHTISGLTRTIYNHPLVVSNAALQSNISITKMHRNMKDVVLFEDQHRIQLSIEKVNFQEQQVYKHLDIVKNRILGEEGIQLEGKARELFSNWKAIRDEVIHLVSSGQRKKAAEITIGKGANHVSRLEEEMLGLTNYARAKATSFMAETEKTHSRLNVTSIVFLSAALIVSFTIALFTIKSTSSSENKLRQSQAQLRTVLDTIPDLVWLKDSDGVYLGCNTIFERFFGAQESTIVGKTDYDFVGQELANFFRENDRIAMQTRQPNINEEELTFVADGYHGVFETIKTPMFDPDGNVIGVLGIARDITYRKKAEKNRIRLERSLRQSQKMESIGNLAGGIAHDFNNILSAIIGFAELALDEVEKNTTIEDSLQEIYKAGKRARDLVKQILAFARQSEEERKPIQPGLVAKEVLHFLRSTLPTNIEINQFIGSYSLTMGSPIQLHQVLMNVCTNAAHAMEDEGGILEVSVKDVVADKISGVNKASIKYKDYIEIKVSDTGIGIAPDVIDSVFDPYFTTKAQGKGTGMGLAVVHGIVESYHGHTKVESSVGIGTTLTILLPITRKPEERRPYEPAALPTGVEKVLLVDDEPSVAKMGEQMLSRLGYSVTTRTSSLDALELFKSRSDDFDLIVSDMTMPYMTGDQLAVKLLSIRHDIPIILCTGYSKKISDETALEIGVKAFVYKPLVKARFAKTVRKVLDEANAKTH